MRKPTWFPIAESAEEREKIISNYFKKKTKEERDKVVKVILNLKGV